MSLSRAPVLRDPFSARCAAIGRWFIVIVAAFTTVSMSLSAVATPAVAAGHGTLDLGTLRGYTGSDAVAVNDTGLVVADSSSEHEASQHSSTPSSVLRTTTNKLSPKGEGFFVKTYHDYSLASAGSGEYSSIAYGDLRSDGRKDLVVGGKSGVNVLLSNGNGTFRPAVAYDTSHKYYNVAVADLNGDWAPRYRRHQLPEQYGYDFVRPWERHLPRFDGPDSCRRQTGDLHRRGRLEAQREDRLRCRDR